MKTVLRALLRVGAVSAAGFAVITMAAGPAAAADAVHVRNSSGTEVSTVNANQTLKVSATADPSITGGSLKLTVKDPTGTVRTLATGTRDVVNTTTLSWDFNTACPVYPGGSCSGYAPAINGVWQFALNGGSLKNLTLAIPPAVVQNVNATADQSRVTISWQPNVESDLVAYDVLTSDGHAVASGIDPSQACANGTCAVTIDFGPQASGTYSFVVRAERSAGPGSTSTISSTDSNPASATITQPTPAPTSSSGAGTTGAAPSSSATGSTSSGSGGTATGGTSATNSSGGTSAHPSTGSKPTGSLLATTSRKFVPAQRLALPAPHLNLPAVTTVLQPLPDGTYKPTLAYPEQTTQEVVREPVHRPVVAQVGDTLTHVIKRPALWRSIAAAAVLLLVAAHLRAWLVRSGTE
jgi:hypothetical protein